MAKKKSTTTKVKKKAKLNIPKGIIYVKSTFNNTILSATDTTGNVIASSSPGQVGHKGSRKSTAYAATKTAEALVDKLQKLGMEEAKVIIKGIGPGRQAAVKGMRAAGIRITKLIDRTPVPHNGCRPKKRPRN